MGLGEGVVLGGVLGVERRGSPAPSGQFEGENILADVLPVKVGEFLGVGHALGHEVEHHDVAGFEGGQLFALEEEEFGEVMVGKWYFVLQRRGLLHYYL